MHACTGAAPYPCLILVGACDKPNRASLLRRAAIALVLIEVLMCRHALEHLLQENDDLLKGGPLVGICVPAVDYQSPQLLRQAYMAGSALVEQVDWLPGIGPRERVRE